jgi:ubiquitin carboxyl-terminal hydrolase 25/28
MERSRSRFSVYEVEDAARTLGFGHDGDIRLEYDEDIEDDFVENAWKELIKRAWRDPDTCAETQRRANEALKLLAEARESVRLMNVWETEKNKMNPDQAYNTLEIPKETDDEMLITVFNMRVSTTLTIQLCLLTPGSLSWRNRLPKSTR